MDINVFKRNILYVSEVRNKGVIEKKLIFLILGYIDIIFCLLDIWWKKEWVGKWINNKIIL